MAEADQVRDFLLFFLLFFFSYHMVISISWLPMQENVYKCSISSISLITLESSTAPMKDVNLGKIFKRKPHMLMTSKAILVKWCATFFFRTAERDT